MTAVPRGIFNLSFNFDKSWLANLADRRYRGTRCLFANAHRALMNLDEEARQEARRIEIRPDSSYFFSLLFPFFFSIPLPFHSLSITFSGIAERRFNRRAWKPVARFFLRGVHVRMRSKCPSLCCCLNILGENWFYRGKFIFPRINRGARFISVSCNSRGKQICVTGVHRFFPAATCDFSFE